MQGRWTNLENSALEERKQSKNRCSPVKLESKKNDKKVLASRDGSGEAKREFF